MFELITQLIGLFGMISLISSFQFKRRRHIILLQFIGSGLFAVHFLLLGAITAVAMNIIAAIRNLLFARYHDENRRRWPLCLILVACVVASIVTWSGWISLLPMMALIAGTIGLWQRDEQKIRLWSLGSPPFWASYNFIVGSIPGVLNEIIAFISILVGLWRYRHQKSKVVLRKS